MRYRFDVRCGKWHIHFREERNATSRTSHHPFPAPADDPRSTLARPEAHRIRFVFTPKHCSWLNQVEIWFSILSRRALKRASFKSTDELRAALLAFIEYFNALLAKPFRWTYTGKVLAT